MRKGIQQALCGVFALIVGGTLLSCGGESPSSEHTPPPDADKTETVDLSAYDADKFLEPFWDGDHVYAETAMLLKDADGKLPVVQLYYPATEIVSVRNFALDRRYEEGKDYVLRDGKLEIPDGSALYGIACDHDLYYQPNFVEGVNWAAMAGGAQLRTEAENGEAGLTGYQIAVTYRHEGAFGATVPQGKSDKLPRTNEKLLLGDELRVVCLGDSISAGWSASGYTYVNRKPFVPPYFTQVVNRLQAIDPQVRGSNVSVPGKTSDWGANAVQIGNITGKKPDLAIIAFGMNDGADVNYVPATFGRNIESIITKVRAVCPDTEFVLVSSMLPNAEVGFAPGVSVLQHQGAYAAALTELENEYEGVAVADVTSISRELLRRKAFRDMSANNINHPNDFMQRVYAQIVLTAITGK